MNDPSKLSEIEINRLFVFAEKKFVHWYDLQTGIVDHLASAIENEMQSTPGLAFEPALEKVYKSFGIFGFAKIVQERQALLAKTAKRRWWTELLSMFQLPGILLTLLIVLAVWTISMLFASDIRADLFFVIYVTVSLLFFIYVIRDNRIQKRLLLMQSGTTYFSLPFTFEFIVFSMYSHMSALSFTILLTLGILIKLASIKLYSKIRREAEQLYPAVFFKYAR